MGSSAKSSTSKSSSSSFGSGKSGSIFDTPSTIKKTPEPAKTATRTQSVYVITDTEPSVKDNNDTPQDFSKERLKEIKEQAEKLFLPFKQGEIITVETRRKTYTGAFGGMVGGKLKVGFNLVPTIDISEDILEKADPELMMKKKQDFIMKNYYIPKRAHEMKLIVSKKQSGKEKSE